MTTPEHTLVGIHATFALGLHVRFGWTVVALAGIVSNLPDWDGLPMFVDMARFESGHRVWGHNFFWILLSSLSVSWLQYRFHWIESSLGRMGRLVPSTAPTHASVATVPWLILFAVCMIVQTIHLPCDMVVSGGEGLSDWAIKPLWPANEVGYVFPLIPWGDIGPTLILMLGVISIAKNPHRISLQSTVTLACLVGYLLFRGWMRGTI